jgi:hypothetical protein
MIARFISSPDGARLGLRKVDDPERLSAIYGPYVDPRDGRIRSREWRVDPVKGTVLWPSMNSRVEGSFVNKGGEYVITAARRVDIRQIEAEEAKTMLLSFLSGVEAAKMPAWVRDSRATVEAGKPFHRIPGDEIVIGPWRVDPRVESVFLPAQDAELNGSFRREGGKYAIENVTLREVHRIGPAEAKAMVLRFLASAEAQKFGDFVKSREVAENSSAIVLARGEISVGRWIVSPLTQEFQLPFGFGCYYGIFVKEGDLYKMYLRGRVIQ